MLTPATSASRTSAPSVIILKARSTQVTPCSSFERLPFEDATTHGLVPPVFTAGAWPNRGLVAEAAAIPAAVVVRTKSRRLSLFISPSKVRLKADTTYDACCGHYLRCVLLKADDTYDACYVRSAQRHATCTLRPTSVASVASGFSRTLRVRQDAGGDDHT